MPRSDPARRLLRWRQSFNSFHQGVLLKNLPPSESCTAAKVKKSQRLNGSQFSRRERLASRSRALLRIRALTSLQHRDFRLLWLGHSLTSMAFWMDQVSRGWLIYELTDSALQLGLVRGIQAIPILLLSPVAGSTADRFSRKKQILLSQIDRRIDVCRIDVSDIHRPRSSPGMYTSAPLSWPIDQTFLQPARAAIIADAVPRNRSDQCHRAEFDHF